MGGSTEGEGDHGERQSTGSHASAGEGPGEGDHGGARLEDLTPGAVVRGVVPAAAVTVVQVQWHGSAAITLTYRDSTGQVAERLLYRDSEPLLRIDRQGRGWSFEADGHQFRLASEAYRIRLAYLFDPMLAVHLSALEPLPHQIKAVYGDMLPRQPLHFLLADDPGAGKTIMAGLLMKELVLRGDVRRCLVVAPGGLVSQWQDELAEKFGLSFDLLTRGMIEDSRTGDPFADRGHLIARLDHLARNDDLQARLAASEWDLVVVDEAHRMAAHWFGNEVKETKRYRLGRLLGGVTRHLLLMTATPHNGKEEDFQLFMALLDADRFEGRFRDGVHVADTSDMMRRMVKEEMLRFDGRPIFPERVASTVPYKLTDAEARLYQQVTDYVVEEMGRADKLREEGEGRRGNRVGFALTVLQRRLASSPEAIYQSIMRRRKRLEDRIAEEKRSRRAQRLQVQQSTRAQQATRETQATRAAGAAEAVHAAEPDQPAQMAGADVADRLFDEIDRDDDSEPWDDLADDELEDLEERLVDDASTARTIAELEAEIATLKRLEALAHEVRRSGEDRKWNELASLLHDEPLLRHTDGTRRKLIVFTEHRDTLTYLVDRLTTLLGRNDAVVSIHGGTKRNDRRRLQEVFTQDRDCRVLVATDAAGEGINLQRAHLMVNYDLPWNPNRIEQRFGRIHRIGQTEVCHLWNLVAEETREGQVYVRLLEKLEDQRRAFGGRVFDVLGEAFRGVPLRDLLLQAIRYGDDPDVRARLDEVIDERVGDGLAELLENKALAPDLMGAADVERIRHDMEEASARRLQPHYVRAFFLDAFKMLGGRVREREAGRFEVTQVPLDLRSRDRVIGAAAPLLPAYERVCFERHLTREAGKPIAELVCPGHPLLESVIDLVMERLGALLKQGAILVDEHDPGEEPRVLVYLEHAIADARPGPHGTPRAVSRRFEFVTLFEQGEPRPAGAAPYLDLRPLDPAEITLTAGVRDSAWLREGVESRALDAAVEYAVPAHLAQVRAHTLACVAKVRAAVHDRLTREVNFWDQRAAQLRLEADAGKPVQANAAKAQARAEDLALRRHSRMAELDQEQQLGALPPVVVGAALVIPTGLLERLRGERSEPPATYARETERVERRAVDAVLAAESALGRDPEEMPHDNPGFDVRSIDAAGSLIFIEVKGRVAGASSVTISRNEILFGLNSPDNHVLALVSVSDDGHDEVRYLRRAFEGLDRSVHFAETSRNFSWTKMWSQGKEPS